MHWVLSKEAAADADNPLMIHEPVGEGVMGFSWCWGQLLLLLRLQCAKRRGCQQQAGARG